jgi:signal transduction histidine kinase
MCIEISGSCAGRIIGFLSRFATTVNLTSTRHTNPVDIQLPSESTQGEQIHEFEEIICILREAGMPDLGQHVFEMRQEEFGSFADDGDFSGGQGGMIESIRTMSQERILKLVLIGCILLCVSGLHYSVSTHHFWYHVLLEQAYYLPILLAAMWFGLRGGLPTAVLAGILYVPHVLQGWGNDSPYTASQYAEIFMFLVLGSLTGVLSDHERKQRVRIEETAQRLSEVYAQLQGSFEQLRRADRLSALGELSAGLAHEIRNPLGSVEGALQILLKPELPRETRKEFGELAQKEIDRLKGLVTTFLDFARPQTPVRKPTDIADLLSAVGILAEETAKLSNIRISLELAPRLPAVPLDSGQMKQVLLNLLINGIHAMPSGGEILLKAFIEKDSLVIEVRDAGIGIRPEHLEKIFDPFFTTRAEGTGLGLSIAYRIVSQHGGHITAKTNHDRGMTFRVTVPLGVEEVPTIPASRPGLI